MVRQKQLTGIVTRMRNRILDGDDSVSCNVPREVAQGDPCVEEHFRVEQAERKFKQLEHYQVGREDIVEDEVSERRLNPPRFDGLANKPAKPAAAAAAAGSAASAAPAGSVVAPVQPTEVKVHAALAHLAIM